MDRPWATRAIVWKRSQADCAHAIPFSSLPAVLFVADIIFGYLDQVNWAALELYLVLVLPRGQANIFASELKMSR